MKKFILISCILFSFYFSNAQVEGHKYKGVMNIPGPATVVLNFTKDTLYLINAQPGIDIPMDATIETMTYKLTGTEFTIKKVSGSSPCDDMITGKYKLVTIDDKVYVTVVDDPCSERAYAWTKEPLIKF